MGLSTVLAASVLALRLFSGAVDASPRPCASFHNDAVSAASVAAVPDAPVASARETAPYNAVDSAPETPRYNPVGSAPETPNKPATKEDVAGSGGWWMSNIQRQGQVAFANKGGYKIFRNVKDYGARGDGSSDDTEAINRAITDGNRCGQGCDSSTVSPAIVYFPPGTYIVSKPIIPYYYTQLIGDVNRPTIKAAGNFEGIAVIDSDPYGPGGINWWTNQNNFFRQVRNFKIDLTGLPMTTGTGIHWQVAQATSLQNIEFNMIQDRSENNKQQGIFMDNGSGGFMTDLTFNGGKYGAFFGNQQFTTRNLKFNNCNTAIYMNWNWVWTFHGLSINNCGIGIDMAQGGATQTVGSVLVLDSTFANTPVGVSTAYNPQQAGTNGTLLLDNVDMSSNVPVAVESAGQGKQTLLQGNTLVSSWSQGRSYKGANGQASQGPRKVVNKPAALVDESGRIVVKSKPQYENVPASRFISVKARGAKGDGQTDDTAAIQAVFNSAGPQDIVYFDHGAYIITDTVRVPKNIKVVGEIWPLIMAGGDENFKDQNNPKPVFQVGQRGDVGNVEMQDLIFETKGPQPGAILMEFNVAGQSKASAGLFDVHFRVGGSAGTDLQMDRCLKDPKQRHDPKPECLGAFMLMHVTESATLYLENVWLWVSDHDLDMVAPSKNPLDTQIDIYNGRGMLIESTKGAWLWGTASEHNVLSNYQLNKAQNVFMGLIQTETAYFQGNPDATKPFRSNPAYADPDFSRCTGPKCARTWGMRVNDSKDILVYGGGLYSFFDNYDQVCVGQNNCQDDMIAIDNSQVGLYGISTKASISMVTLNGQSAAKDSDNRNNFCAAIAAFETS
ncbi:hypothetical protein HIM_05651 [Hirsutella minnesotensis 3608]|uniref:Rhamnogalacturonase A/B/Epimerase-like pectate lyase domain-containing protein n=1 Tax=Hirsutella minnesotensis 3608 TaxID=1043627 RepID=A0A0F7ZP57_9HYPO|nr:hypothetical protein HIM_05651 [Hirsutella minnesotensis 3608]